MTPSAVMFEADWTVLDPGVPVTVAADKAEFTVAPDSRLATAILRLPMAPEDANDGRFHMAIDSGDGRYRRFRLDHFRVQKNEAGVREFTATFRSEEVLFDDMVRRRLSIVGALDDH